MIENNELRALITGVGLNVRKADRPLPPNYARPICLEELMPAVAFSKLDVRTLTYELVQRVRHWNAVVAAGDLSALESQWQQLVLHDARHEARTVQAMADEYR